MGFSKESVITDIMSVHGQNLYFEGRGPSPCFNMISWISSQNRQFTSFVLIVCFKGVMSHQRSVCEFISIYGNSFGVSDSVCTCVHVCYMHA